MTSNELRRKYLTFFEARGHKIIPSASLIPAETDPTVLFTTAGMHPLVPFLMGEKHPAGKRLANIQRCIRTGDIDEVGDESHLTFFEMMGYWSLGDYWKKEAIEYIFEFLTKELGLDPKNFAATCFEGDVSNNIDRDTEAHDIWRSLGIPEERIAYLGYEDNWWGPAGATGPCGPDSELFVWVGEGEAPAKFEPENKGWMELCNDVFMQYNKTVDGKFEPLQQKNVDFGMGFERLVLYINKETDIYKTDLFWPIIQKLEELSGKKYHDNIKEFRIIADHLKAAAMIISDGIEPSNKDHGYVVRRLLRKTLAALYIVMGNKYDNIFSKIFPTVESICVSIKENWVGEHILTQITKEEEKFFSILIDGINRLVPVKMNHDKFFNLFQSNGLYPEIIFMIMAQKGYELDQNAKDMYMEEFNSRFKKHQELSRTTSAGMFKGGLADNSEETTQLHTVAHLLLASLRKVLGEHVVQKGSNITAERLRFDFLHPQKLTPEQIAEVEKLVNEAIDKKASVEMAEMSIAEAKESGAHGVFDERYGDKVKVYTITNPETQEIISKEICGGPHVSNTAGLGHFRIKKEESSSAGVRRIKAVLE